MSYPANSPFTWDHWRVDQIRGLLAEGWEIFAYLDTHSYVVDEVRALGSGDDVRVIPAHTSRLEGSRRSTGVGRPL